MKDRYGKDLDKIGPPGSRKRLIAISKNSFGDATKAAQRVLYKRWLRLVLSSELKKDNYTKEEIDLFIKDFINGNY